MIVFPKFIQGPTFVDFVTTPQTEIELGVVCPTGVSCLADQLAYFARSTTRIMNEPGFCVRLPLASAVYSAAGK